AWEDKGGWYRCEVDLPGQFKLAGGVGEATCAARPLRGFMIVVHSRRFRRAQVSLERAVDFVAVGRKPVKSASVRNIVFTKIGVGVARTRKKFRCPSEGSQFVRVSEVIHMRCRL